MRHYAGAYFPANCTKCGTTISPADPRWYDEEKRLFFHDACYTDGSAPKKPDEVPSPSNVFANLSSGSPPTAEGTFRPASSYRDPLPPHATVELEVETVGEAVVRRVLRVRLSLGVSDPAQLIPAGDSLRKQAENIELSWLKEGRA